MLWETQKWLDKYVKQRPVSKVSGAGFQVSGYLWVNRSLTADR